MNLALPQTLWLKMSGDKVFMMSLWSHQRRQRTLPTAWAAERKEAWERSCTWRINSWLGLLLSLGFPSFSRYKAHLSVWTCNTSDLSVFLKYLNATVTIVYNICLYVGCSGLKIHILETVLRISSSYKGHQIQMRTRSWQFSSTVL